MDIYTNDYVICVNYCSVSISAKGSAFPIWRPW